MIESGSPQTFPAISFARELVASLVALGVSDFVLCPGSRSGPFAHALAEAGGDSPPLGAPNLNLYVRIDERSAGFLALGMAKTYLRQHKLVGAPIKPVAVITTSGTAVGNLLPAVMEAHHSGAPIIVITADRPAELQHIGANQTTNQQDIFGGFVRQFLQVEEPQLAQQFAIKAVQRAQNGPVHVNVQLRDPLTTDNGTWDMLNETELKKTLAQVLAAEQQEPAVPTNFIDLPDIAKAVVIAGDGAGEIAGEIAAIKKWPLFAEPHSGARHHQAAVANYLRALASPAGMSLVAELQFVLVIGRPSLSRQVQELIKTTPTLWIAGFGALWKETPKTADLVLEKVPAAWLAPNKNESAAQEWLAKWEVLSQQQRGAQPGWNKTAAAVIWAQSLGVAEFAFVGNSGPIRSLDWDLNTKKAVNYITNRGLSGIDGNISTAAGIHFASGKPVDALVGDLTFLHEVGGLWVGRRERQPLLRVTVINDYGGSIFSALEHAQADASNFERVFTTPHNIDIEALVAAYRLNYQRAESATELKETLAKPISGFEIVEVAF